MKMDWPKVISQSKTNSICSLLTSNKHRFQSHNVLVFSRTKIFLRTPPAWTKRYRDARVMSKKKS